MCSSFRGNRNVPVLRGKKKCALPLGGGKCGVLREEEKCAIPSGREKNMPALQGEEKTIFLLKCVLAISSVIWPAVTE